MLMPALIGDPLAIFSAVTSSMRPRIGDDMTFGMF